MIKERIYQAAFVVLMAFFVFILFNDVSQLGCSRTSSRKDSGSVVSG